MLAIGLPAAPMFEVLLTGLSTYTAIHTTCRIDMACGAKLFHNLLGCRSPISIEMLPIA